MGVVPPLDGFNAGLRRITAAHGALLILDEVMTGFRVSRSGWYGLDPVDADLFTFGKVMGGGLPAAAFGGRADLMDQLAPVGPVYQAGTLSGNPVAVAAGPDHAAALHRRGLRALRRGRRRRCAAPPARRCSPPGCRTACSRPAACSRSSSCPTSARCATTTTPAPRTSPRYTAFFHAMLARGVYLPPSAFEAWFVNAALTGEALDRVLDGAAAPRPGPPPRSAGAEPSETVVHLLRHGEVLQPRQDPLRPAARLPAVRRRRGDGARRPRSGSPAGTSRTWCPARSSARSRPPRRSPRRCRLPVADRRAADRGRQRLRGPEGRRRRRRPARAAALVEAAQPVPALVGRALRRDRRPDARPRSRPPATPPAGTRPSWSATSCRSGPLRLHLEGRRYVHDPRRRQCGLASVTSLTYDGDRIVGVAYAEPAGATDPDAVPGA